MKIKNIFKKENKTVAKANVEKLAKNQLAKVIGGGDETLTADSSADNVLKTKHDTVKNTIQNIR
jgi:urate oxidase